MTATEHLIVAGYGVTITWDGQTLRAKGTNKATHFALMGQNDVDPSDNIDPNDSGLENIQGLGGHVKDSLNVPSELALNRGEFTVTKHKMASALINGELRLKTTAGKTYRLHFRKKHNDGLAELLNALGVS